MKSPFLYLKEKGKELKHSKVGMREPATIQQLILLLEKYPNKQNPSNSRSGLKTPILPSETERRKSKSAIHSSNHRILKSTSCNSKNKSGISRTMGRSVIRSCPPFPSSSLLLPRFRPCASSSSVCFRES